MSARRILNPLIRISFMSAILAPPSCGAQLVDRLRSAVGDRIEARARASEDLLVLRSEALADSLATLGLARVDSLTTRVAAGAVAAITFVGQRLTEGVESERARLADALEAGRVDLRAVFHPSSAEPTSEGEALLALLGELVAERNQPVMLESPSHPELEERRVRMVRLLWSARQVPTDLIFIAPGASKPADGETSAVELRVWALH